jgi:hypothetical protein
MSDMAIILLIFKASTRPRWRGNLKGLFTRDDWLKFAENHGVSPFKWVVK